MAKEGKITIREADLGPVIARADHRDGAIEVNSSIFYRLPPMVQEFVLCHEVCHLRYAEWDEGRTNRLAVALFLNRSADDSDRASREEFVSYIASNGSYSNFAWWTLIQPAISLGYTVYGVIRNQNAGWYSWDGDVKASNLKTMLKQSFEQARKSGSQSASEFFWQQMQNYTGKDRELNDFLSRTDNRWVNTVIKQYEKQYGFGFYEVTPVDITAYPLAMVAIGLLVGLVVYKIIEKVRK